MVSSVYADIDWYLSTEKLEMGSKINETTLVRLSVSMQADMS